MNEKQQQLTFEKGITNVPSDALCSDNALEESTGLFFENGEHRPVQKPVEKFAVSGMTILFVHKFNALVRYVGYETVEGTPTTYKLCWYKGTGTTWNYLKNSDQDPIVLTSNNIQITSVGKTLVISADGFQLTYFLWKGNTYQYLDAIPAPQVDFRLVDWTTGWGSDEDEAKSTYNGIIKDSDAHLFDGKQEDYNNLIIGLYSKLKNAASEKKRFTRPFFIRAAVEMFDGTYTMITNPILLVPSIGNNFYIHLKSGDDYVDGHLYSCRLQFRQLQSYSDYRDLVKDVVLFVSDQVETLKTTSNVIQPYHRKGHSFDYISYSGTSSSSYNDTWLHLNTLACTHTEIVTPGIYELSNCPVPEARDLTDIDKDLKETSIFYRLGGIGTSAHESFEDADKYFRESDLKTLVNQEQLPEDDYFSRNKLFPSFVYAYNDRINLANVKRSYFEGYDFFMPYQESASNNSYYCKAFVTIKTDTDDIVIQHNYQSRHVQSTYFYYPDSRATDVEIYKSLTDSNYKLVLNVSLEEHTGLNGAFYFKGLSASGYSDIVIDSEATPPSDNDNDETELLPNYIITSEVNNPFVFKAEGYNKVGTGNIMAISTITQALSQGQFGQYPLLVFSDEGIWAMSVDGTGLFKSVYPMSREVLNNIKSVTQTDGAVFFSSEKGLMVVVGNEVVCVSEQLAGKAGETAPFAQYLKTAYIAYDYRDSLLWIFNNDKVCYLYSIKSKTFSRYDFGTGNEITNVVNSYPDYLLQSSTKVLSLLERPNINADGAEQNSVFVYNKYAAQLKSRPMKLENALALKSIMQVKHIYDMGNGASMTLHIFASNDLKHWVELHSLRGTPWKYYKFRYDFTNLIATDKFAGTMLITQERRTDKLR